MLGGVREDYCITPDGRAISGVLGGNAVYAAVGARLWSKSITIVSRVGANYPRKWLESVEREGISTAGIRILDQSLDTRTFYAYRSLEDRVDINPPTHYRKLGLALPKALVGYSSSTEGQDQRSQLNPATVRTTDIPAQLLQGIHGAHLSPAEFLTHFTLPKYLKDHGIGTVTLDPSIRYMNPSFRLELPTILQGLQAFLPSLYEATSFLPRLKDQIWEMAEFFHSMGPPIIVIKAGASGQFLLDAHKKRRWHIPAYPSQPYDVTGAGDAFCGAFLVGLIETGDALEAALRGNISASFVVEGSGALYALKASPSLVVARLESLRGMVREE
jgi:sugar/nucleoside kinase (ribokinase family)